MSTSATKSFKPPPAVKGMKSLEKKLFQLNVTVPVVIVDTANIRPVSKFLKPYFLKFIFWMAKFKPIQDHDRKSRKVILNPDLIQLNSVDDILGKIQENVRDIDASSLQLTTMEVKLQYENWTAEDILSAVLPFDFASFSQCGHIIHLNLRENMLPFKHIIAQVLLDRIPSCRTVVNKLDQIDNVYRTFAMEIIAGDDDMICTTKEYGCVFKYDFSKVYWNSRLGDEHNRILRTLKKDDVLLDVFAGVGPFAVPAAKIAGLSSVFANDLNCDSYKWLLENCILNNTPKVKCFNMDGADFIKSVVRDQLMDRLTSPQAFTGTIHVVMNLPACAVSFLKHFVGLVNGTSLNESTIKNKVLVNCYLFVKNPPGGDFKSAAVQQILQALSLASADGLDYNCHIVRQVAPEKKMICISFYFPPILLISFCSDQVLMISDIDNEISNSDECCQVSKKQKVS